MKEMIIKKINVETGCGLILASAAFKYAYERNIPDYRLMVAYVKAKTLAVKTYCTFDERVEAFYEVEKRKIMQSKDLVISYLKEHKIFMGMQDINEAAKRADSLFCNSDYDRLEDSVEDVINSGCFKIIDETSITITFKGCNIYINYNDGSDVEKYEVRSIEDIEEIISGFIQDTILRDSDK
jgi:hypothetical protein